MHFGRRFRQWTSPVYGAGPRPTHRRNQRGSPMRRLPEEAEEDDSGRFWGEQKKALLAGMRIGTVTVHI